VLWFGVLVGVVTGALSIIFKIDGPAAVILILTQLFDGCDRNSPSHSGPENTFSIASCGNSISPVR
jgi:hypothetical protein